MSFSPGNPLPSLPSTSPFPSETFSSLGGDDVHQPQAKEHKPWTPPIGELPLFSSTGTTLTTKITKEITRFSNVDKLKHAIRSYNEAETCPEKLENFEKVKKILGGWLSRLTCHKEDTPALCAALNWMVGIYRYGCFDHQGKVVIEANTKTSLKYLKSSHGYVDPSGYAPYVLGKIFLAQGKNEAALDLFTVAMGRGNEGSAYYVSVLSNSKPLESGIQEKADKHRDYYLGKQHYHDGKYHKALKCFDRYIGKHKGVAEAKENYRLARASTFVALAMEAEVKPLKNKTKHLNKLRQRIEAFFTLFAPSLDAGGVMHRLHAFVLRSQGGTADADQIKKTLEKAALLGNAQVVNELTSTTATKKEKIWRKNSYLQGCQVLKSDEALKESPKLDRFIDAQTSSSNGSTYAEALAEMKIGGKISCWVWYIFPQLSQLYQHLSPRSKLFGIEGLDEARAYLRHPLLSQRLYMITDWTLKTAEKPCFNKTRHGLVVMGTKTDEEKLISCMSLFTLAHFFNMLEDGADTPEKALNSVFSRALERFTEGKLENNTVLKIMDKKLGFNKNPKSIHLMERLGCPKSKKSNLSIQDLKTLSPKVCATLKQML